MTVSADSGGLSRLAVVPTIVGAVLGGLAGGLVGIRLGIAMLDEPTRTSDNILDDLFPLALEAIVGLVFVAFVTIAVLCIGVAVGVYVALRLASQTHAGATALVCIVFDVVAVPAAFFVAISLEDIAPSLDVLAGLSVLVLVVPLAARWVTTRFTTAPTENPS